MYPVAQNTYDETPREVVATDRMYPSGYVAQRHTHGRGQFAFAATGVMSVSTTEGNWIVPNRCAFWVPAGVSHEMRMSGAVRMLNAFIRPDVQDADLPVHSCVLDTSPLLRDLLVEAVRQPAFYDYGTRAGRIMSLLIDEIGMMRPLSLHAPIPGDARLAALCCRLYESPSLSHSVDSIAGRVGMSRRSFTRIFREQTGMSFVQWRQQVCLMAAVKRLEEGESVTRVALDLGYSSQGAFSVLFKRVMGISPSAYLNARDAAMA